MERMIHMDIMALAMQYNLEIARSASSLIVVSPKPLPEEVARQLSAYFQTQGLETDIIIGPKPSLLNKLAYLTQGGSMLERKKEKLIITCQGVPEQDVWEEIVRVVKEDGFYDYIDVRVGTSICYTFSKFCVVPTTKRETCISSDDILNLRIALETATSLEDFERMI
jgi:hypothetical protein